MKKVKISDNKLIDNESDEALKCCFFKNHFITDCSTECVACEIKQDGAFQETVTCLRGSFIFAIIIGDDMT